MTTFQKGQHIYFIGIGGISMSGLAEILAGKGCIVSGTDIKESPVSKHLQNLGIHINFGHKAENITDDVDLVVYTAAIHPDNPEYQAAQAKHIPLMDRARLLGEIMAEYEDSIAVAGTHGKTTTTSMVSEILLAAGTDPTITVGGILPTISSNLKIGHSPYFVAEACEYFDSFLQFKPFVGVILNVESDHLDYFKNLANIRRSFHAFADLVPQRGFVIANADDSGAMAAVKGLAHPVFTFSVRDDGADCRAENVAFHDGCGEFDVMIHGKFYAHVALAVAGKHNISNALAAAAAAYVLGIGGKAVEEGLHSFHGAGRRFEFKGTYHGADVFDDYAHHPGELHALLTTARSMPYKRIICAFQPHTYTRTQALFEDFVRELKLADIAVLAEIYAARETNDIGISSSQLAAEIPGAIYCSTLDQVADTLAQIAQPEDLILTVGAGDIFRAGEKLLTKEK